MSVASKIPASVGGCYGAEKEMSFQTNSESCNADFETRAGCVYSIFLDLRSPMLRSDSISRGLPPASTRSINKKNKVTMYRSINEKSETLDL